MVKKLKNKLLINSQDEVKKKEIKQVEDTIFDMIYLENMEKIRSQDIQKILRKEIGRAHV